MVQDFLQTYFLDPIASNGWFNPVNTIVYSIILIIAVFFVFKLLFRMGIKIDKYFFYATAPFIFWGSSTRVLHDAAVAGVLSPNLHAIYISNIFPTPGSYLITFTFAIISLFIGLGIQKYRKIPYWKPMTIIGTVGVLINLIITPWIHFYPLALIGGLTLIWVFIFYGIYKIAPKDTKLGKQLRFIFSPLNQIIIAGHMLDASATYASLAFFGYIEQHVVPRTLFPIFGPEVMFPLKLIVVIPVLYFIDRYSDDENFKNFLKLVVFILGVAPGLRDVLRLIVGV